MKTEFLVGNIATKTVVRKATLDMSVRRIQASLLLACLLVQFFVIRPTRADNPSVVINELMWMGSSASSADEWVELRNMTHQLVDLSGWQLTKKSNGTEAAMLTLPPGSSIPADGFFLVSNYASTSASSVLSVTPDVVTTDVALSNTALQIKLYDNAHALVDIADDGIGNPLAGTLDSAAKHYFSMERNLVPGDGTLAQSWHTASQSIGFKAGAIELGTPASNNSNGLPVAVAGPDQSSIVGQTVNFDGSDSSDPEGQPLTYDWDFGDGQHGASPTPQHIFSTPASFIVKLTISDGIDVTSDSLTVTVTAAQVISSPSSPTPTVPSVIQTSCRGVRFSELYPNPPGVDTNEFIELENAGDEDINLNQCSVVVNGTKKYTLADKTLAVGDLLLLSKSETKLTLTNASGQVRLLDTDGTELDRISYDLAKESASYALINGQWQWTSSPTPGKPNALTTAVVAKTTKKSSTIKKTPAAKKSKTPAQNVSLSDVQQLDSGDRVVISGTVTSTIGSLGSTLTTIQSSEGAVTLSVPNGTGPFVVGQPVEVTGTIRLYQGRRRVAVDTGAVHTPSTSESIAAQSLATNDVGQDQADELVHVKGVVALASGNHIDIDDGSGPVTVYIKSSTGIVRPKIKMGDTLEVSGIVGTSTSGIRVYPRSQDDLRVERVLGASTTAPAQTTALPTNPTKQTAWYWAFVGLGLIGAVARPAIRAWKKRETA